MRITRSHGLGNVYLVVEAAGPLTPAQVVALCDRATGVGADGALEPLDGGARVRIWNPDGSLAEKSGNGLRIYARWRADRGAASPMTVWTDAGPVVADVSDAAITVDMGVARIVGVEQLAGVWVTRVDVGNPHAVVDGWPPDWRAIGARLEHAVEGRTNVQFVDVRDGVAHVRIWERGAGETPASGSSACAVARVCVERGALASPVTVRMAGGDLRVEVAPDGRVRQTGPVEVVSTFDLDPRWTGARGWS